MKTVKQVSKLSGISVRMLHYYDQIGLLKPGETTDAGYRLYSDREIETLQQILFYKELDIPLKEIKEIMASPQFDKTKALESQRDLLVLKEKRLNGLIELINQAIKGESRMSFEKFDMSEYYNVLEQFKTEHGDKVIKIYGSMDKYNELVERCRSRESEIAKMAEKKYGSIEKYAKAVKKNLSSDTLILAEQYDKFKKDFLEDKHPKLKELFESLASGLSRDPASKEIQQLAEEIAKTAKRDYEAFNNERGDDCWYYMVNLFSVLPEWMEAVDRKYGAGASKFIGEALKNCSETRQPRLEELYIELVSDLERDPHSKEIQRIVEEISAATRKSHEFYKVDEGENYWGYTAELYSSDPVWIKVTDKKYGVGASKFIGEALKYYAVNCQAG